MTVGRLAEVVNLDRTLYGWTGLRHRAAYVSFSLLGFVVLFLQDILL